MPKNLLIHLAPALLIIVALCQIFITQTNASLNPDKGGGFGLFSTNDKLNNRVIQFFGITDGQESKIKLSNKDPLFQELLPTLNNARSYPTHYHLKQVAEEIFEWNFSRIPDSIRIEVRKCRFDAGTQKVHYDIVNQITLLHPRRNNKTPVSETAKSKEDQ